MNYTSTSIWDLSRDDCSAILQTYGYSSDLIEHILIPTGSSDACFHIIGRSRSYFLKILGTHTKQRVIEETRLMQYLYECGFPTPSPFMTLTGDLYSRVLNNYTILQPYLYGNSVYKYSSREEGASCIMQVATHLGEFHLLTQKLPFSENRKYSLKGILKMVDMCKIHFSSDLSKLDCELLETIPPLLSSKSHLCGKIQLYPIHGDLFRDNVLFDAEGNLLAFIDFQSSTIGHYVYDIVTCINDWCYEDNQLSRWMSVLFVESYQKVRVLSHDEVDYLPEAWLMSAFRFYISRMVKSFNKPHNHRVPTSKMDYEVFANLIKFIISLGPEERKQYLGIG